MKLIFDIDEDPPTITSTDYWYKVTSFLSQHWAAIEPNSSDNNYVVYFFGDSNSIFDYMVFDNEELAKAELILNGFTLYDTDFEAHKFVAKPQGEFLMDS